MKKTIGIIFGGVSPEHEVSVITGLQVLKNINKNTYNVIPVYISKKGRWYTHPNLHFPETYQNLEKIEYSANEIYIKANPKDNALKEKLLFFGEKNINIDAYFLCFHGGLGEGGGFQALFELLEIPYIGSGLEGSVLGMDKVFMKQILGFNGFEIGNYEFFYARDWNKDKSTLLKNVNQNLKYPLFIKPAKAGSSIGISKITKPEELENGIDIAFKFDSKIIVEEGIRNSKEINVSVIGNAGGKLEASVCEEVFFSEDFLTYNQKYAGKEKGKSKGMASAKRELPAKIPEEISNKTRELAKKVFETLGCSGLARIDFLINIKENKYSVIEINTIPGSMSFYLWEKTGLSFEKMIDKLIGIAFERHEKKESITTSFKSNILENFENSLKGPKGTKS